LLLVDIDDRGINICREFLLHVVPKMRNQEWGIAELKRNLSEHQIDTFIGKLAEVAVAKFMFNNGCRVYPDFNRYPRKVWDYGDLLYNGWKIEIKGIDRGKWLIIEKDPFDRKTNGEYRERADFYFLVIINIDEIDSCRVEAKILGYASDRMVADSRVIRKGEDLEGVGRLQTTNHVVQAEDLSKNFNEFLKIVNSHNQRVQSVREHINTLLSSCGRAGLSREEWLLGAGPALYFLYHPDCLQDIENLIRQGLTSKLIPAAMAAVALVRKMSGGRETIQWVQLEQNLIKFGVSAGLKDYVEYNEYHFNNEVKYVYSPSLECEFVLV